MLGGHALLNVEGACALAFLLILFVRTRSQAGEQYEAGRSRYVAVCAGLGLIAAIAYWPILSAPFVFDDYRHIADAQQWSWKTVLAAFGPVEQKPGLFFRPFGFLVYWLNFLAAGVNAGLWHASSIVIHAINCCLLFALCRQLRLSFIGSAAAAALFAVDAVSAEAVAWIDARFDPMSTGLALASLLCVCRYLDSGAAWIAGSCGFAACAMFSKESAFCVPLLAVCLRFFRDERKRWLSATAALFATAGLLFAYRMWALGGIGGYRNTNGQVTVGQFHWIQNLNAVFLRDWTILFFPLNWSTPPGSVLMSMMYCAPVALLIFGWFTRARWKTLLGGIAFTTAAAIPVQHLLLIGTDLSYTRVTYMLGVGWAILWAAVFSSLPNARWRVAAVSWMLLWNFTMLRHNLQLWVSIPQEARSVCASFGKTIAGSGRNEIVFGLPQKKNGVTYLSNGFPECVAMNSDVPASRVSIYGKPTYVWNEAAGRIEPVP